MRKRNLLMALTVGLVALAGVAAFVAWPRVDRITRENADRIRPGMTQAEVEAILGPPGDYRSGATVLAYDDGMSAAKVGRTAEDWVNDRGAITLEFNQAGRVVFDPAQRVSVQSISPCIEYN